MFTNKMILAAAVLTAGSALPFLSGCQTSRSYGSSQDSSLNQSSTASVQMQDTSTQYRMPDRVSRVDQSRDLASAGGPVYVQENLRGGSNSTYLNSNQQASRNDLRDNRQLMSNDLNQQNFNANNTGQMQEQSSRTTAQINNDAANEQLEQSRVNSHPYALTGSNTESPEQRKVDSYRSDKNQYRSDWAHGINRPAYYPKSVPDYDNLGNQ